MLLSHEFLQIILYQVASYKTEMDSIAEFIDHECSVEADLKYPAAKLYEAYRHYCQAIGPQASVHQCLQESLRQTYKRLSVPYFQWDAVERYQACSTVLSQYQCR